MNHNHPCGLDFLIIILHHGRCLCIGTHLHLPPQNRPDNMAVFENIRIEANKESYPVLLSNGNSVESGDMETDPSRHFAVWTDPFPKPSYLFAVVAGSLGSIKDSYTTTSGKEVHLEIFSELENVNKLDYAMDSLKRSMKWDEDKFGLEYDLGIYNIVAVNDFNMGAVSEQKKLYVVLCCGSGGRSVCLIESQSCRYSDGASVFSLSLRALPFLNSTQIQWSCALTFNLSYSQTHSLILHIYI
jgi:hypothetical protein